MPQTQQDYTSNFLKIFRPWDNVAASEQDATVTTTTLDAGGDHASISDQATLDSQTQLFNHPVATPCSRLVASPTRPHQNKQNTEDNLKTKEPAVKPTDVEISVKKHLAKTKETKHKSQRSNENSANAGFDTGYGTGAGVEVGGTASLDRCGTQQHGAALHTHLAQSLGLSAADALFLESMAHGYALEEYARVLSQDQHARLLSGKKQRPKKYKCPHCDVGFSNNGQLKGHIRIHTGERPYRCDETNCGKTFTRNEELTRHKRIHSGLRPFPCSHCGKRFGRKDHLKKHTRTHIQNRPAMYAIPVMLPSDPWGLNAAAAAAVSTYPYMPSIYGY